MRVFLSFVAVLALLSISHAAAPGLQQALEEGFSDARALKPMASGTVYSVQVGGVTESGPGDRFLRRRGAGENEELTHKRTGDLLGFDLGPAVAESQL
jgi:hypothetical protein